MTYAGPPAIFSIDEIEKDRGCIAPGSIAQTGEMRFSLAQDGIQMMRGVQSVPIGAQKVYSLFFGDVNASSIGRMVSIIDRVCIKERRVEKASVSTCLSRWSPETKK